MSKACPILDIEWQIIKTTDNLVYDCPYWENNEGLLDAYDNKLSASTIPNPMAYFVSCVLLGNLSGRYDGDWLDFLPLRIISSFCV